MCLLQTILLISSTGDFHATLWWSGPLWLKDTPEKWPKPNFSIPLKLLDTKAVVLLSTPISQEKCNLWTRYSSFHHLVRIVAWIKRFHNNFTSTYRSRNLSAHLSTRETLSAKILLLRLAQKQTYEDAILSCLRGKHLSNSHPLSRYTLSIDPDGLLKISGRVRDLANPKLARQRVPLSLKSNIVRVMIKTLHVTYHYAGVATLMSIIGENYHIPGLRNALKQLSRQCSICQRAHAGHRFCRYFSHQTKTYQKTNLAQILCLPLCVFCHKSSGLGTLC